MPHRTVQAVAGGAMLTCRRASSGHERAGNTQLRTPSPRARLETAIEAAIGLLDQMGGDADIEAIDEREPENEGHESWAETINQLAWVGDYPGAR